MMKSPRNVRIGPRRTYKNETTSLIFKKSTSKKRNYPKKNHIAISIILYLSLLPLPWSYNGLCVNARIVLNQKSYQTKIQTIKFKGSCRRINFQKQVLNKEINQNMPKEFKWTYWLSCIDFGVASLSKRCLNAYKENF